MPSLSHIGRTPTLQKTQSRLFATPFCYASYTPPLRLLVIDLSLVVVVVVVIRLADRWTGIRADYIRFPLSPYRTRSAWGPGTPSFAAASAPLPTFLPSPDKEGERASRASSPPRFSPTLVSYGRTPFLHACPYYPYDLLIDCSAEPSRSHPLIFCPSASGRRDAWRLPNPPCEDPRTIHHNNHHTGLLHTR